MEDKLRVIYENNDFLIIDKESGITVNRSDTTSKELTLQDLVEEYTRGPVPASTPGVDAQILDAFSQRNGIVHRLDKETSGLIIVAKKAKAFEKLQFQFKNREVVKSYLALVHGEIRPETGEINAPVGRLPWSRKRFGVLAGGREATTSYEVVTNYQLPTTNEKLSLVRLFPKTGRTHQIRVHLKYINHPIFSDPLYGGRKNSRQDRNLLPRIFLHAESLTFKSPRTGKVVRFESKLPMELKEFIESLTI